MGKESVVLCIAMCKCALKSTKVKLRKTYHKRLDANHWPAGTLSAWMWLKLRAARAMIRIYVASALSSRGAQFKPPTLRVPAGNVPDVSGMFCVI